MHLREVVTGYKWGVVGAVHAVLNLGASYMGMFTLRSFTGLHHRFSFVLILIFTNIALKCYISGLLSILIRGEQLTCLALVPTLWGWEELLRPRFPTINPTGPHLPTHPNPSCRGLSGKQDRFQRFPTE